jgi:DNA invertase Pin-like site-specific DNA recombinase
MSSGLRVRRAVVACHQDNDANWPSLFPPESSIRHRPDKEGTHCENPGRIRLAGEFYDGAVSGADPIDTRPGFASMLERIEGNGVRTIIVETASRFARDLMVQEVGHAKLRERGIDLIATDNPGSFIDDTPTAKLVRQVLGAISEFDKAMTVAKLRGARERKRREAGKCEGRKSHAELNPELVALAKRLRRQKPKGGRMSLRAISAELATQGFLNENGRPFAAASVRSMIE